MGPRQDVVDLPFYVIQTRLTGGDMVFHPVDREPAPRIWITSVT